MTHSPIPQDLKQKGLATTIAGTQIPSEQLVLEA
jgi:hypothetical protein